MPPVSPRREFAFLLYDVARLLRTLADRRVRQFDLTRAQWAVLAALERGEGVKQSELAEILEIRPITLTRLVDRLCANELVERRPDPDDRRAKRLFLRPQGRALAERLSVLGEGLMAEVLSGIDDPTLKLLLQKLCVTRENLRQALPMEA